MFDTTKVVANALGEHLALTYQRTFGSREPRYAEIIEASARLTIERIAEATRSTTTAITRSSSPSSLRTSSAAASCSVASRPRIGCT